MLTVNPLSVILFLEKQQLLLVLLTCLDNICHLNLDFFFFSNCPCSMAIESVLDKNSDETPSSHGSATCTACQMMIVWVQNQLKRNQTEEQILEYINQVSSILILFFFSRKRFLLVSFFI